MWYMFKTFFGGGGQKKELTRADVFAPQYIKGTHLDMYVFLSEQSYFDQYSDSKALVWTEKDFVLGTEADRTINVTYIPSKVSFGQVQLWIWLHLYNCLGQCEPE